MNSGGWERIYSKPLSLKWFISNNLHYLPYLLEILKLKPRRALEVGCGSASNTIFLSFCFPQTIFVAIDNNPIVCKNAQVSVEKFKRKNIFILKMNAFILSSFFNEDYFDVAYSQGFFEHFDDEEIRLLLLEQLKVAKNVIFEVPSEHHFIKAYGDERFLSPHEWRRILSPLLHYAKIEIKYFPFDLSIRTRYNLLKENLGKSKSLYSSLINSLKSPLHIIVRLEKRNHDFYE